MSIKKGLALLLAMTLGFTPVMVSAAELETVDSLGDEYFEADETADNTAIRDYEVRSLTFKNELEDKTVIVGQEVEFSVDVEDKVTDTVSDPDAGQVPKDGGYIAPKGENELNYTWTKDGVELNENSKSVKIKADKVGTFKVQVTVGAKKACEGKSKEIRSKEATVTVLEDKVESIKLNKKSVKLIPDKKVTLKATIEPEGVTAKVKWSSSDKKIAKVDQNGKVTAVKPGKAIITAEADGKKATATIKVAGMDFYTEKLVIQRGSKKTIGGNFKYDEIDKAVVTRDVNRVISVKVDGTREKLNIKTDKTRTGKAFIQVTSKAGITKRIVVIVQKDKVKTRSITIVDKDGKEGSKFTVKTGKRLTLTVRPYPDLFSTGDEPKITRNTDKKVASAEIDEDDGELIIKGKKKGETKITVKVGPVKETIKIKVKNK